MKVKKMKRLRILILALCVCLIAGVAETLNMVDAYGVGEDGTTVTSHTHCICGASYCNKTGNPAEGHTGDNSIEWTAWDGTDAIDYGTDNTAYVYLTQNVEGKYAGVNVNQGKTLYLCLNGHKIVRNSNDSNASEATIVVYNGANLILCDCKRTGNITHGESSNGEKYNGRGVRVGTSSRDKATFTMYGGTISNNHTRGYDGAGVELQNADFNMYGGEISNNVVEVASNYGGGGVNAYGGGTFNMYGGTISNNHTRGYDGGGVSMVAASFNMYGGTISGNTASEYGGGIAAYNDNLTLTDGEIKNNSADKGGGIAAYNDNLTLTGGEIKNNSANKGGGVYMYEGSSDYTITLSGNTSITGNTATEQGGGVYYSEKPFDFSLSGNVNIKDNVKGGTISNGTLTGGTPNNVYLSSGKTIRIAGALTGSPIGVTTADAPDENAFVIIAQASNTNTEWAVPSNFTYENDRSTGIFTKTSNYTTYLVACKHNYSTDWSSDENNHWHQCTACSAKREEASHSWSATEYNWTKASNKWMCTAKKECTECKGNVTENGTVTSAITKSATCTEEGETTYTATFKGNKGFTTQTKTVTDIAKVAHNYGDVKYVWTEDGKSCTAEKECNACKDKVAETATVANDKIKISIKIPATCIEKGTTTYSASFSIAGFELQTKDVQDIAMAAHDYGDVKYIWTEDGKNCTAEKKCNFCRGKVTETATIENGKIKATVEKPATCTEEGETTYTATFDGENSFATQTKTVTDIAKIAHSYGIPKYNWTKDDNGWTCTAKKECTECNDNVTENGIVTSAITKSATCTEEGETTYTATFKGNKGFTTQTKTVTDIAKVAHNYGDVKYVWTEDGKSCTAEKKCNFCRGKVTETATIENGKIKATVEKPATCTEEGETTYTATFDGENSFATQTKTVTDIAKIAHSYGIPKYNWTKDDNGWTCTAKKECTECNDNVTENGIVTSEITKAATCTEKGETTYTATFDGGKGFTEQKKVVDDIAAQGHTWDKGVITTPATTTAEGVKTFTCAVCKATKTESVPKIPSGGGVITPPKTDTITADVTGDKTSVKITAEISGDTASIAEIGKNDIDKAGAGVDITIDLTVIPNEVVSVTVTKKSLDNIYDSKSDNVSIKLTGSTVNMDRDTLKNIIDQMKGSDLKLVVDKHQDALESMNKVQQDAVKDMREPKIMDAYFISGGIRITDFKGGSVDIKVPYPDKKGVKAWYIDDNGIKEPVPVSYDGKTAVITVNHFSHYVLEEDDSDNVEPVPVKKTVDKVLYVKSAKYSKKTGTKITFNKVSGADGYYVYGNRCNTDKVYKFKKLATLKGNDNTVFVHKKTAKNTFYKYYIKAYKVVDGKRVTISTSKEIHFVTDVKGYKYGNPTNVTLSVKKYTLSKGKTFNLKNRVKVYSSKKVLLHTDKIRYVSSDSSIAKVNSKGKITAKKAGSCNIYAIAQNGRAAKIAVTVK